MREVIDPHFTAKDIEAQRGPPSCQGHPVGSEGAGFESKWVGFSPAGSFSDLSTFIFGSSESGDSLEKSCVSLLGFPQSQAWGKLWQNSPIADKVQVCPAVVSQEMSVPQLLHSPLTVIAARVIGNIGTRTWSSRCFPDK